MIDWLDTVVWHVIEAAKGCYYRIRFWLSERRRSPK